MSQWIESDAAIWSHYKTKTLCRLLKIKPVQAVGHLTSLWHFILENCWRDADMTKWGDDGIEDAARWEGKPGVFAAGARESGYLDGNVAHGWLERAGKLIKDRLYNERRKEETAETNNNAVIRRKANATVPDRTVPDRTVPDQQTAGRKTSAMFGFDEFWKAYPRRENKQNAIKAWKKASPDGATVTLIHAAIAVQKKSKDWLGGYIPHPTTWINGRRWEDEQGCQPIDNGESAEATKRFLDAQEIF